MIDQAFTQPGFQTPAMTLIRDGDEQTRRLGCCDVGGEAHGGPHGGPRGNYWAPGILGTDCFIHLGDAGQDISGSVHVDMRLVQDALGAYRKGDTRALEEVEKFFRSGTLDAGAVRAISDVRGNNQTVFFPGSGVVSFN